MTIDIRDNPFAYRNLANRNPFAYRKPMQVRQPKSNINYNANDVWAAAVQAQTINGQYLKYVDPDNLGQKTNRQIVTELLADPSRITKDSREKGEIVRKYFNGLTFKVIEGKKLNDFAQSALTVSNKDTIVSSYDLAIIVSLPATYEKSIQRDTVDRRINFARGGFIGKVGDKVTATIEVVKSIYSPNYNVFFITGITDKDEVVFFSFKTAMSVGIKVDIQGTVKQHRDSSTQLNRVKVK